MTQSILPASKPLPPLPSIHEFPSRDLYLTARDLRAFALVLGVDGSMDASACPYTYVTDEDASVVEGHFGKSGAAMESLPSGFKFYRLGQSSSDLFLMEGGPAAPVNFEVFVYVDPHTGSGFVGVVATGASPEQFIALCK